MTRPLSNAHPLHPRLWEHFMDRRIAAALCVAALGLGISSAHAGSCSTKIAQFELAVRQSAANPNAGLFGCTTAEDILKSIKDKNIQMIDLRFTDLPGTWQAQAPRDDLLG